MDLCALATNPTVEPSLRNMLEKFTPSQNRALAKISTFLSDPKQRFFLLQGSAGTGKTHLLGVLSQLLGGAYGQVGCAPTNKATKVFAKKMNTKNNKTIYSLLGVVMEADEDQMVLKFPFKPASLQKWDVVYLDEASMLPANLVDYILRISAINPHLKWVLSADRAQLPPVGEKESAIWSLNIPKASLTDIVRYDNQILQLATHIRDQIKGYPNRGLCIDDNHANGEGVWRVRSAKFFQFLGTASTKGLFHEVDDTKAIAWTNSTVKDLNAQIRAHAYGRHAYKEPWIVGDRVMLAAPIMYFDRVVANIDEEGTVVSVEVTHNTFYKHLKCYNLVIKLDEGSDLNACLIHEDSETDLDVALNKLASAAKIEKQKWKDFWILKNSFHKLRHSFAITAHRAQGSTFKNVFLDTSDILKNRSRLESLKCLYVAATRPTTKIIAY